MWSALDRSYLPPEDEARFASQQQRILAALRVAPQDSADLAKIAMDYLRRIRQLRERGYSIRSERLDGGLWLYTLLDRPDPEWKVVIMTTFPDGHVHIHTHIVHANTLAKARNVAQHGDIKTKIVSVEMISTPYVLT